LRADTPPSVVISRRLTRPINPTAIAHMEPTWQEKQREYEAKKARAKALRLRLTCTICGARPKTLLNCPCGTTQYCSTECQRIDWRDRGHRKACKTIRAERAAEAARAEAPTPPSPPKPVVYGPAPRSHADEVRTRIAAEHEAARARREANPEPEPASARFGSRCPICLEKWDVNLETMLRNCCCRLICMSCDEKIGMYDPCPLCRLPASQSPQEELARVRRHVENEVPEAINWLGSCYRDGDEDLGIPKNCKKAAKLCKRAVELGNVDAMRDLGVMYSLGCGVKIDLKKAMQLHRMAMDRGDVTAGYNLGLTFQRVGDIDAAFRCFRAAADQGHSCAMVNVGNCYFKGSGVQADLDEAMRWYERGTAKGDEKARIMRNRLRDHRSALDREAAGDLPNPSFTPP